MRRSFQTRILALSMTLVLAFSLTTPVAAQGLVTGDSVPAGTVLDQDAILIGQNVAIDGTVNGDVFVLGNQVTVNGKVDGSIIVLGQNAGIGGIVTGGVYVVALTLDLAPRSSLDRDLYVASVSLTSGEDSVIGRDLFALGLDSGLNGSVGRNLHTVIGPIQLYNGLMTLLGFDELTIRLHFESPQTNTTTSSNTISMNRHAHYRLAQGSTAEAFDWGQWALKLLRNWAVLLIFGLLAMWIVRKPLERSGEPLKTGTGRTIGIGFLTLALVLALILVTLLLAVLIFAIGLSLNSLGLWQLSIALWIAAYACLALALVALWFFVVYGAKIIVLYCVGTWVFGKLFQRKAIWMDMLALLAATTVYALLRTVPYVGWVFGVVVTAAGAGSAWRALRRPSSQKTAAAAQVDGPTREPTPESTKKAKKRPRKA